MNPRARRRASQVIGPRGKLTAPRSKSPQMRYRVGEEPVPGRYGSTDDVVILTAVISIAIGFALVAMGRHGNQLWLKVWGGGLVVVSIATIGWEIVVRL